MPTSIVFGSNGYIGRHLVYYLSKEGHQVIPISKQYNSIDGLDNYQSVDVSNFAEIANIDFNVDYIFVFAGLTGTKVGFDLYQSYVEVNEIGLLNILEHRKNSGGYAKIVFPSTRLVYKGNKNSLIKEIAKKETKTIYAQNKLTCEGYLNIYANFFNITYIVYRICVPYGNIFDSNYSYGTVNFFLKKARNGDNITLYGKGEPKRTFTHVEDICKIIIRSMLIPKTKNEIFNIASNDHIDLLSIAQKIALKYNVGIDFISWPDKAKRLETGDTMFDGSKLNSLIDYNYKHRIYDWINSL